MRIKSKPYVGITGVTSKKEADDLLRRFPGENPASRLLMIGVLAKEPDSTNPVGQHPNRYPAPEAIADIFPDDPRALGMIHYNGKATGMLLARQLYELEKRGGPNLKGFQLNIPWPHPKAIAMYKDLSPHMKIVLQIGIAAMAAYENDPDRIALAVIDYDDAIDYVLVDPSCGQGRTLDIQHTLSVLHMVRKFSPGINLGVAGGLAHETLRSLQPIIEEFPDISIDAETKLRDEDDRLDPWKAEMYIKATEIMFRT
jgi:hypothetical protein